MKYRRIGFAKVLSKKTKSNNMVRRKDDSMKGYVMLPCFTVEIDENGGCEMTCNNFLGWIFETFFAPFWHGKVYYSEGN